jgi:hypothetical protein
LNYACEKVTDIVLRYRTILRIRKPHFTQQFAQRQPYQLGMSAKCPPPSSGSTGRKKPFLQQAHVCHHPDCSKGYKTSNGLCMHVGKSPQCCNYKMSRKNTSANTASLLPALDAQEALTEYPPWDEDDSFHESEIASSIEDNISTAATNHHAGVFTELPNDAALRFSIRFTTVQFHETKLLKLLSNANAPHFVQKCN